MSAVDLRTAGSPGECTAAARAWEHLARELDDAGALARRAAHTEPAVFSGRAATAFTDRADGVARRALRHADAARDVARALEEHAQELRVLLGRRSVLADDARSAGLPVSGHRILPTAIGPGALVFDEFVARAAGLAGQERAAQERLLAALRGARALATRADDPPVEHDGVAPARDPDRSPPPPALRTAEAPPGRRSEPAPAPTATQTRPVAAPQGRTVLVAHRWYPPRRSPDQVA